MSDEPKYRDEEWLREQYVEKRRPMTSIAEECGCVSGTISTWLNKHGVETRNGARYVADEKLSDEEWLRKQVVQKEKTQLEVAKDRDVSRSSVSYWVRKHDIKKQEPYPDLKNKEWLRREYVEKNRTTDDIAEELGCGSGTVSHWLEEHNINTRPGATVSQYGNLQDSEWLHEKYVVEELNIIQIAEIVGGSRGAVVYWLNEHDISTRGQASGENHWNWNGGSNPYGPGWNDTKRREVRERDDHTCQDPTCSVTRDDHLDQYDEKLHVHHLIKARDIDDPEERNAPENLITLCRDCHQRWERLSEAGIRPQIDGVTAD